MFIEPISSFPGSFRRTAMGMNAVSAAVLLTYREANDNVRPSIRKLVAMMAMIKAMEAA